MCQHSWYKKGRRRYGPKPNTRRARGLPRRDLGIKRGMNNTPISFEKGIPEVERELVVKEVKIPRESVLKRYVKIYNWYVRYCDNYRDNITAYEMVEKKFCISHNTAKRAIQTIKYVLAITSA